MNLKLVLQLSLFGLIMAFATVSLIPQKIEPAFWLVIFVFVAYVIAKVATGKYFLHGFMVSIFNSIWITAVHIYFYNSYSLHHPNLMVRAMQSGYFSIHPRLQMLCMVLPMGAVFGLFQGLFAFVVSKIVKPNPAV